MTRLILSAAERDERVRAVFLNGSRANPNAPRDRFRDYDVVYLVREVAPFLTDFSWLDVFGEELIFQFPDLNDLALPLSGQEPPEGERVRFGILMQFVDGNRIDLTLLAASELDSYLREDSETILWLDKDGRVPALPPASDRDYWAKKPGAAEYRACCNEFYWVSLNVAKGLARNELTYAHEMLDHYTRDMLLRMLSWRAGLENGWAVSTGKCGKYLNRYLPPEEYARLLATYADGEAAHVWDALAAMYALFRDAAVRVGAALGYPFPSHWHDNVTAYATRIRRGD